MNQKNFSRLVLFVLAYTFGTSFWVESSSAYIMQFNISIFIGLLFIIIVKLNRIIGNSSTPKNEDVDK
jgi:hypothetical protein